MKAHHLLALSGAMVPALLIFAASQADAQSRQLGPRITIPSYSNHFSWERGHGFKRGFPGIWIVEREVPVIVEKEVVREVPVPTPGPSSEGEGKQRKAYVIGGTYASLPDGCMKMIEEGVSYFYCSGEWYREVGGGRGVKYRAVARRL